MKGGPKKIESAVQEAPVLVGLLKLMLHGWVTGYSMLSVLIDMYI